MRIETVRIQNFRCFEDESVTFNNYTCLVGANGSGKSTVLTALRVFFRDAAHSPTDLVNLQEQDFHGGKPSHGEEVVITVTFSGLDSEASEDFKHYVRQEKLFVSAVARWDAGARTAEVKQYGQRMMMKAFAGFFRAADDGKRVAELKALYAQLQDFHKELPAATSKQEMLDALRAHESIHPELCDLERSEDQFYGFTKGANLLRKHLEWAFVPAVKDAAEEQLEAKRTALGLLLDRTVRSKMSFSDDLKKLREEAEEKYAQILGGKQGALSDLSSALTKRLREWAHPDAGLALNWRSDPSKNISIQEPQAEVSALDGSLQLAISRMGHGLQRSFLLALLQELSGCPSSGKPKLLLACEEPELYQHPPQARHLSSVLQNLSSSNAQVMVCTHSPLFVQGRGFPDVRLFRRAALDDQPSVHSVTMEDLAGVIREARGEGSPGPTALEHKIQQILQPRVNEMFFTPVLILVEGDEDLAYVETYLALSGCYDDFRRLGCHVVPTSGKGSMVYALGIARQMDIPTFLVFDADGDKASESEQPKHERDNLALLRLAGVEKPQAFPPSIFSTRTLIMWPKQIGRAVREDVGEAEWERCETVVRDRHRLYDLEKSRKSALYIGMTLTVLYEGGGRCKPLEFLCKQIISFAQGERSTGYGPPAASAPDIQPPTTPVAQ